MVIIKYSCEACFNFGVSKSGVKDKLRLSEQLGDFGQNQGQAAQ